MSALGLTQTVLATELLEAYRKDIFDGICPFNIHSAGGGKIENGHVAEWLRSVAKNAVETYDKGCR
jgi:hypothetical protein